MNKFYRYGYIVCLLILLGNQSLHAEEYYADFEHKGIIALDSGLVIFPENRLNNAVYDEKNEFLYSAQNSTIITAVPLNDEHVIYAYRKDTEAVKLNYFSINKTAKVNAVVEKNALLIDANASDKYVYFLNDNKKIEYFIVKFKSASNFIIIDRKAIFYYVKGLFSDEESDAAPFYLLNIMIIDIDTGETSVIKHDVQSYSAKITLELDNDENVSYKLQNGRREVISFNVTENAGN